MNKQLGKIQKAYFGYGGYQDVMIGITFQFSGDGWGISDFWGQWAREWTSDCKWTEQSRRDKLGDISMRIAALLTQAKVKSVEDFSRGSSRSNIRWRLALELENFEGSIMSQEL